MEEMNAEMTENEELEDITEVEEAEESGSAGVLVVGVVGGFPVYVTIGGAGRLWGFVGAKLAECKAAEKAKAEAVDAEYIEVAAEGFNEEDSEK